MKTLSTHPLAGWLAFLCLLGCDGHQDGMPNVASSQQPVRTSPSFQESSMPPSTVASSEPTNRLGHETSPYLLMHAHNPVDWYPWGPEAFEAARKENKPIFLSIGYSSCYWCHVMERQVFSNREIAEFMNAHFINIKVDREERPDIDDIYMTALSVYFQVSGVPQNGGWPLSMFLTPTGQPIAGGTYFPPEDQGGRPGFPSVLHRIADAWRLHRESVEKNAEILADYTRRSLQPRHALAAVPLTQSLVDEAREAVEARYDPEFGGVDFNPTNPLAPKFPVPTKLALLQHEIDKTHDTQTARIVYHTLDRMADGGIRDQLGGGFHRYSTDREWLIPHFEKMLYDNAQIADVYVKAYQQTQNENYAQVAREIFTFIAREMTDRDGAFYSALDAETDAIEGKFYVWSSDEIDRNLDAAGARTFKTVYGVVAHPEFEHGNVLHLPKRFDVVADELKISPATLKKQLIDAKQRLLAVRNRRQRPFLDDKILTSWNGLMIRALANASIRLNEPAYRVAAERAATFICTRMRDARGRLQRTFRDRTAKLDGYLDDYAFFVEGLLALYEASSDSRWLQWATRLTDDQIQAFWDDEGHGFFFTSYDHEELLARTKNGYDAVLPSGNSVSVRNLIRLAQLTQNDEYRQRAETTLNAFAPQLKESPNGMPNMALALAEFLDGVDSHPAARPTAVSEATGTKPAATDETRRISDRLTAQAFLSVDRLPPGGECRVAVVLDVAAGWHINANPAQPDFLVATTVSVKSRFGTRLSDVRYPRPGTFRVDGIDESLAVYSGRATVFGTLHIPDSAAGQTERLEVQIHYQACNDAMCQRPETLRLAATVPVAKPGDTVRPINESLFSQ